MKRKLLSVLLTLCLAFSLLPTAALADGETAVAKVGDVEYPTLAGAVAAVADGGTVTLLGNVTELETISITGGKKVDLNLNEKNITFKADNYFLVDNGALNVTGKGNITSSHGNDNNTWLPTIYAYGTDADTANYSVVTIGKDVVIDNQGSYGLAIGHKNYKAYGAKVIVEGTVTSTYGFTVTGNAKATEGNIPEITVTESGKIVSTDGSAIYAAGYGIYNIAGTLSGINFGIEIRAGKLNVEDTAKISATGNFSDPVPNGNGSTVTGAAIAVSQHTTNLPIDVNIKGGEISETGTNGHALYEIDTVENEAAENVAKDVSITVSGGSFNGNVYSTNNKLSITGGAFTDIANAVKYAADNATIKLAGDVSANVTIPEGKTITLDLNGKTLNGGKNNGNAALLNKGTVTIKDSSATKTGTIKREDDADKTGTSYYVIKNLGTMTIEQANVINNSGYKKTNPSGSMVGSSLICNGDSNKETTLTINDGVFEQQNFLAVKNGVMGILNVNGGKFTSKHSAIQNWYKANIKGGIINGQLWTDAYIQGESVGETKISGTTKFTGEIVMDITGNTKPTLEISGGEMSITNWRITSAAAKAGAKPVITGGLFSSDPSDYVAAGHYVDASNNGDYPYTVKEGTKPDGALIVVKDKTDAAVSNEINDTDKGKIQAVKDKANVDGVAEAVSASKAALVSSANITPAATDKVEVEVKVNVTVTAANLSAGTLTFEAKPTATITVTRSDNTTEKKENVSVPNSLLSGEITVKLPLPADFKLKQIIHKSAGYADEYILQEGNAQGLKSFKIVEEDGVKIAVFTVSHFSDFELSGKVTYVAPSYSGGSSSYDPTYSVSTPSKTEHGTVTVSPKSASKGDRVTVTVKPDSGYVLETLTVTDKNGNELTLKDKGNGKYTFTMPAGKVEVKATFMEDNSMLNFFYDVPNNAYFYEAVKWAVKNGITTGVGNNLFAPEQPCTRAQIVTFLWRAAGSPEPKGAASGMTDVVSGSYYEKAVAWAIENGITTGTTTSTFSPDATCTRAQAVTFLARALKAKAASAAEFSDVPTDSYFADAVAWAAANGVTEGIGGGLFGSDNDCTRGQIVTFLYRAYNK